MAKDPAFLFYSSDFLTGTLTMTDEQVGKFIRLLCLQHQKFELSEKDMMHICKSYDEDIYEKFKKEDSKYYNERLREESIKRKNYSDSRRKNKLKKDMKNICLTHDEHMENENENEIVNKDININKNGFFKESEFEELPEQYQRSIIEQMKIQKQKDIEREVVISMWQIFKTQNLTGDKFYNNRNEVYRHFTNWIKTQKFEQNAKPANEKRFDAYIEFANRYKKPSNDEAVN